MRLTELLKPEHRQAGLEVEDDEDFVYLKRGNKTLAIWNATKATRDVIQAEADRQMAEVSK